MMDRLISIFCILATSCITCSVSIVSQIKGIVLSNNLKKLNGSVGKGFLQNSTNLVAKMV